MKYADDVCFLLGAVCVTRAAAFVHVGLAWFAAGCFLLLFSVMLGKAKNS